MNVPDHVPDCPKCKTNGAYSVRGKITKFCKCGALGPAPPKDMKTYFTYLVERVGDLP